MDGCQGQKGSKTPFIFKSKYCHLYTTQNMAPIPAKYKSNVFTLGCEKVTAQGCDIYSTYFIRGSIQMQRGYYPASLLSPEAEKNLMASALLS